MCEGIRKERVRPKQMEKSWKSGPKKKIDTLTHYVCKFLREFIWYEKKQTKTICFFVNFCFYGSLGNVIFRPTHLQGDHWSGRFFHPSEGLPSHRSPMFLHSGQKKSISRTVKRRFNHTLGCGWIQKEDRAESRHSTWQLFKLSSKNRFRMRWRVFGSKQATGGKWQTERPTQHLLSFQRKKRRKINMSLEEEDSGSKSARCIRHCFWRVPQRIVIVECQCWV